MAKLDQKNNTKGRFVLLYDSIDYQPWSDDPFCMLVAQFLIRKAAYSDYAIEYRGNHLTLKPGQYITTLLDLADKAKVVAMFERFKSRNPTGSGKSAVKCCMDKLVADGFLSVVNVGKGNTSATLITINNWVDAQAYSTTQSATQSKTQTNTQPNTHTNTVDQQGNQGVEGNSNTQPNTQQTSQSSTKQTTQSNTVKQQEKKNNKIVNNNSKAQIEERFAQFWKLYPNKKDKKRAQTTFQNLKPDEQLFTEIMSGLQKQIDWRAAPIPGEFIPEWKHPNTWLNGQNWNDEITRPESNQQQANRQPGPAGITTNAKARKLTQQFGEHNHG